MNPPLLDFVVINSTVTLSDVSWFQNFKARASRLITICSVSVTTFPIVHDSGQDILAMTSSFCISLQKTFPKLPPL